LLDLVGNIKDAFKPVPPSPFSPVQPKFSAYLDVVRFLAALMVFLGHGAGAYWTDGFLWQLGGYGDTCVVIFFVLSGFVIAYVAENKEGNWWTYTANRVARLWSVVIPALALTFIIDYFGVKIAPQLYVDQPWFNGDHLGARYLVSFFLLHETWSIGYAPGINQPFWSLGYEAFYYLIFGVLAFYKGRAKTLVVLAVCALGGPLVVALFPLWMAGVVVYRKSKAWDMSTPTAVVLFVTGSVMLALSPFIRLAIGFEWMGQEIAGRYVDAIAFILNLVAARHLLGGSAQLSPSVGRAIKRVASTTFVLYLFHRPLIQLFSYIGPSDPGSWERRALVIGGTLVIVALATPLCEYIQKRLRIASLRWLTSNPSKLPVLRTRTVNDSLRTDLDFHKMTEN
jgi:peptidoglycan/LPS O-acetylase OafA/YrhL